MLDYSPKAGFTPDPRASLNTVAPATPGKAASMQAVTQDLEKLAHVQAEEIGNLVKLRDRLNAVMFGPCPSESPGSDSPPIPSGFRDLVDLLHKQRNLRDSILHDIARLTVG